MKNPSILKNLFSILFGRTSELILTFFAITILIRYLGATQYGVFSSTIAMLGIFSKFIDLGFSQIIFREFSLKSEKRQIVNSAISIRLLLFFALVTFYNVVGVLSNLGIEEVLITNILFVNIIISAKFRNIRDLLEIPFKSHLRMDIVMGATFIDSILLLSLILLGTFLNLNLLELSILYTIANLPGFLVLIIFLKKKDYFRFHFEFQNIKWLIKESFPLWGAGALTVIFIQFDVVLLKMFLSSKDAGLYSAALRIGVPFSIIPLSIITTVFPVITQKKDNEPKLAQQIIDFSFKIIGLLLVFVSIIITFKSNQIISLLYGTEFTDASLSLIFIFWAFTFYYLGIFSQNLNTIINLQKDNFYYSVVLIFFFLLFLSFFLLLLGPTGAGLSRLLSAFIGFMFLIYRFNKSEFKFNLFNFRNIIYFLSLILIALAIRNFELFLFLLSFTFLTLIETYLLKYFNYDDLLFFYKILKEPAWMKKIIK